MAKTLASQAKDGGSIPLARSHRPRDRLARAIFCARTRLRAWVAARRSSTQASSRCSLRQAAIRSGSSASRTAQPGSVSWPQSREAAPQRELVDVGEGLAGAVPQAGDPDAGGVDQVRAGREGEQLARDRGVAAAAVGGADLAGLLALLAEQGVDQRRLAGARGAEQDGRGAGREQPAQDAHPLAGEGADGDRVDDAEAPAEPRRRALWPSSSRSALVSASATWHAAAGRERGEALEPARLGVGQRLGDEREVDVGGQDVAAGHRAGRAADDRAAARLDRGDRAALVELHEVAGDRRLGQPPAGGDELGSSDSGCDQPEAAVLREHARRVRATGISTSLKKGHDDWERAPGASARDPISGSWR